MFLGYRPISAGQTVTFAVPLAAALPPGTAAITPRLQPFAAGIAASATVQANGLQAVLTFAATNAGSVGGEIEIG